MKETVIVDNEEYCLNSTEVLKDGDLFGVIIKPGEVSFLEQNVAVDQQTNEVKYSFDFCRLDDISLRLGEKFPLILRRISMPNGCLSDVIMAQDILTGNIFAITNMDATDFEMCVDGNIKKFQEYSDIFEKSKIIIKTPCYDYENLVHVCYAIDDGFKQLYAEKVLSRKDYVVDKINEMVRYAERQAAEKFKKGIDVLQNIATTDNFLIDTEKKHK